MAKPDGYKDNEYSHFMRVNGKRVELSFEEIERLSLNKTGNEIPFSVMNVVNIERYMMYYWKPFLTADGVFLYLHLWEFCRKEDGVDICYPSIDELASRLDTSRPTVVSKIKKLEEYNFLIQIHRHNKLNNNKETSPIFKLRQTMPFLSKELYEKLNPFLQKKHDDYMAKFATDSHLERFSISGSTNKEKIAVSFGDVMVTKKTRTEIDKAIELGEQEAYIMDNVSDEMKETLTSPEEFVNKLMESGMSRPTAQTVFSNGFTLYNPESKIGYIIVPSEDNKQFAESFLNDSSREILLKAFINMYEDVYDIKFYSAKQYIVNILKGK